MNRTAYKSEMIIAKESPEEFKDYATKKVRNELILKMGEDIAETHAPAIVSYHTIKEDQIGMNNIRVRAIGYCEKLVRCKYCVHRPMERVLLPDATWTEEKPQIRVPDTDGQCPLYESIRIWNPNGFCHLGEMKEET